MLLGFEWGALPLAVFLYGLSVPPHAVFGIKDLHEHFREGVARLSGALNTLEAAGYLHRRRVRLPNGRLATRTFLYDASRFRLPDHGLLAERKVLAELGWAEGVDLSPVPQPR
ncbi:hypothetical protein G3I76_60115 [Streptomyces sp. SID11233]|nr:hypothetical protein [Streptomyces sp. SID11233]